MEKTNYDIKEELNALKHELSHINEDDFSGFVALYKAARNLIQHLCHHPVIKDELELGGAQLQWLQNMKEECLNVNPQQFRADIGFSLALCQHILDEEGWR